MKIIINNEEYSIDDKLAAHWIKNSLEHMKKANSDRTYVVDGHERCGKSTWTVQQAAYLDKEMFSSPEKMVSRICFTPEDFIKTIRETKNGVIIFDEAFRGLSSRAAISKVNKSIIQALMEMGQQNNIVFIILPSFFMLDIYPAMLRSNGLFNIYIDKRNNKRSWRGFNRQDKNIIYKEGLKKGWSYNRRTMFKGRFYGKFPGGDLFEQAYLKKKAEALKGLEINKEEEQKEERSKEKLGWLVYECALEVLKSKGKDYGVRTDIVKELHERYGVVVCKKTIDRYRENARKTLKGMELDKETL